MAIPTLHHATRWAAAANKYPRYLAMYNVTTSEIFDRPPPHTFVYMQNSHGWDVLACAELLDWRTYDLLKPDVVPSRRVCPRTSCGTRGEGTGEGAAAEVSGGARVGVGGELREGGV